MGRLAGFLQEDDGSFSATRLGFLAWVVGVLAVWITESVITRSLQPVPQSVAATLAILMAGKVVQKRLEGATPTPGQPSNVVVPAQVLNTNEPKRIGMLSSNAASRPLGGPGTFLGLADGTVWAIDAEYFLLEGLPVLKTVMVDRTNMTGIVGPELAPPNFPVVLDGGKAYRMRQLGDSSRFAVFEFHIITFDFTIPVEPSPTTDFSKVWNQITGDDFTVISNSMPQVYTVGNGVLYTLGPKRAPVVEEIRIVNGSPTFRQLDDNRHASGLVADGDNLYQIFTTGKVLKFGGQAPPNVHDHDNSPGWQIIGDDPRTRIITAGGGNLYQLRTTGDLLMYTGTPLTGWQLIDSNPSNKFIIASENAPFKVHDTGNIFVLASNGGWAPVDLDKMMMVAPPDFPKATPMDWGELFDQTGAVFGTAVGCSTGLLAPEFFTLNAVLCAWGLGSLGRYLFNKLGNETPGVGPPSNPLPGVSIVPGPGPTGHGPGHDSPGTGDPVGPPEGPVGPPAPPVGPPEGPVGPPAPPVGPPEGPVGPPAPPVGPPEGPVGPPEGPVGPPEDPGGGPNV